MAVVQSSLLYVAVVAALLASAHADIYMHNPRGSNNALNENNVNRNNANRLFDSQNNGKGGYRIGENLETPVDLASIENQPNKYDVLGRMEFIEGSELPLEWTNQHGCGDNPKVDCEIVWQYMCSRRDKAASALSDFDPPAVMTDGVTTGNNGQANPPQTGLHESTEYYNQCKTRERNKGLFIADQDLRDSRGRNKARNTRQNPNGNRYGNECPEERDYYPYWHPSPWRDVAVLVSNNRFTESVRQYYQQESQNVKAKGYCTVAQYNRKETCEANSGTWAEEPAHGIAKPMVELAPLTRDNHLGNSINGQASMYNWTVPLASEACGAPDDMNGCELCVLRVRYNISIGDYDGWNTVRFALQCWRGHLGVGAPTPAALGASTLALGDPVQKNIAQSYGISGIAGLIQNRGSTYHQEKGPKFTCSVTRDPPLDTESACTGAGGTWQLNWKYNGDPNVVDSPVVQNPVLDVGSNAGLRLALNTAQTGRVFEDRTHIFKIAPRSAYGLPKDCVRDMGTGRLNCAAKVYNINVRGKRGNIVQVYPAVEYDFVPARVDVRRGDFVHFQWTGSNRNPNGNDGEGRRGTDRSNVVMLKGPKHSFPASLEEQMSSKMTYFDVSSLFALKNEAKKYATNNKSNVDPLLNNATPYFNAGIKQITGAVGTYHYMCTRNNNFTNRSQKGAINVVA